MGYVLPLGWIGMDGHLVAADYRRRCRDADYLAGEEGPFEKSSPPGLTEESSLVAETTRNPGQSASTPDGEVPTEIEIGIQVQVKTGGKNLHGRGEPGLSGSLDARFEDGSLLKVIDGPVDKDGYTWWQVEGEAGVGWSAADYLLPYGQ